MRTRLWYEMGLAKFNERYLTLLIGKQRLCLNYFNLTITVFSTGGFMGWRLWDKLPLVSCIIISSISLLKLIQQNIIPSEKQIEKLDKASDFYFNLHLELEKLWFDFENDRIDEKEMQNKFHELKQTERPINQIINELHKRENKKLAIIAEKESIQFFNKAFNLNNHE